MQGVRRRQNAPPLTRRCDFWHGCVALADRGERCAIFVPRAVSCWRESDVLAVNTFCKRPRENKRRLRGVILLVAKAVLVGACCVGGFLGHMGGSLLGWQLFCEEERVGSDVFFG